MTLLLSESMRGKIDLSLSLSQCHAKQPSWTSSTTTPTCLCPPRSFQILALVGHSLSSSPTPTPTQTTTLILIIDKLVQLLPLALLQILHRRPPLWTAASIRRSSSFALPTPQTINDSNSWTCIYPIYLDAKRPYGTGQRRVERAKSLWWPLSKDIADAAVRLGLGTLHEVTKSHPRDWENPGRVRVQWKKDGGPVNPAIKSSMVSHSYLPICAHPRQRNSFLRLFASRYSCLNQRTYQNHPTT